MTGFFKKTIVPALAGLAFGLGCLALADEPLYVVLKLDDLSVHPKKPESNVDPRWDRVLKDLESRNIKASIGVICQGLENDCPKLEAWVKALHEKGNIEFWCHGYTHKEIKSDDGKSSIQEFKGVSLEEQVETLKKCQEAAQKRFGFKFAAFGSPFNGADANTPKALAQFPEIKVWFFGKRGPDTKQFVLDRPVDMENPTLKPDFEKFKAKFETLKGCKVITLQGHPPAWTDERFAEFEKVLDYLVARNAKFVTPGEYLQIANGK